MTETPPPAEPTPTSTPDVLPTPPPVEPTSTPDVLSTPPSSAVQIEGRAYGRQGENIQVAIDFMGSVAAEAYRYGEVQITSAKSDTGEEFEFLPLRDDEEFVTIDRSAVDTLTDEPEHPQDGFRLLVDFFNPTNRPKKITTLKGIVSLQTIDPSQIVTVEQLHSFLNQSTSKLENPNLDSYGTFSLELDDDVIYLVAEGQEVKGLKAQIIDAEGRPFSSESTMSGTTEEGEYIKMGFGINPQALEGARLEIIPPKVITVEKLDSFLNDSPTQSEEPPLDSIDSLSLELVKEVNLLVEGQNVEELEARIIDAQENVFSFNRLGTRTQIINNSYSEVHIFNTRIKSLEGARLEIIPASSEVITVEKLDAFLNQSTIQLEEPQLSPIGNFSLEIEDFVHVVIENQKDQVPWDQILWDETVRIIDAQENVFSLDSGRTFTTEEGEGIELDFEIKPEALAEARLEIISASSEVITVENPSAFLNQSSSKIENPKLDPIGSFSLKLDDDVISLVAKGQYIGDLEIRIIDAQEENIFFPIPFSFMSINQTIEYRFFNIPAELLIGARLEIIPAFETTQVPFELTDLNIESDTGEDDEDTGEDDEDTGEDDEDTGEDTGEAGLGDLLILADKLESCERFIQPFTHPFTGEIVEREIVGTEDSLCIYREEMPNNGLMECKYPPELRVAVADYYRLSANSETVGVSVSMSLEESQIVHTIDGEEVENPLQYSLDNGICVVSGY